YLECEIREYNNNKIVLNLGKQTRIKEGMKILVFNKSLHKDFEILAEAKIYNIKKEISIAEILKKNYFLNQLDFIITK
ncbi:hypothetical protein MHK_008214, partial [Candidatus Magnetomorum sp. HK-1]